MDVTKAPVENDKMAEADTTKLGEEPASKVNYQELKDWIAELEAYEATTGKPAPLTPAQSKAIAELSRAAQGPNPLTVNVDIGDKDFFGVMNRKFRTSILTSQPPQQTHAMTNTPPDFVNTHRTQGTTVSYTDDCVLQPNQFFTSTLTLTLTPDATPVTFPSASTGGLINSSLPSYTRKKDARKYAAKCCVEWLVANNHLLPAPAGSKEGGGYGFIVPKLSKKRKVDSDQESIDKQLEEEGGLSPMQRVIELCNRLGMSIPRYEMLQIGGEGGGLWSGYMDWGRDQLDVPDKLGKVDKVFGKRACKEAMAEEALVFLRGLERKREGELARLMEMEE